MGCPNPKPIPGNGDKNGGGSVACKPTYKIIVVGNSGVGKTAIIHQYVSGVFNKDHVLTTGVKNQIKDVTIDGLGQVRLEIWDTVGQEEY